MKRSDSPRPRLSAAFALLAACAVPGCGLVDQETPPCRAGMPAQAQLLRDSAFQSLAYHRRLEFEVTQGLGYDVWADSRFEYRSALQFSLVPMKGARSDDQLCFRSVGLRLALPMDARQEAMLPAFLRDMATGTALDVAGIQAQLADMRARGEKYRAISRGAGVTVEAGVVSHPSRGDFFVVGFAWPEP